MTENQTIYLGNPDHVPGTVRIVDGALSTTSVVNVGDITLGQIEMKDGEGTAVAAVCVAATAGTALKGLVVADPLVQSAIQGTPLFRISAGTVVVSNGNYTTPAHTLATAGTTAVDALVGNANRLYARIQNDGTSIAYLKLGATAVANQGIKLETTGGACFYEMSKQNGNLFTGTVTAIVAAGSSILLVTEGV